MEYKKDILYSGVIDRYIELQYSTELKSVRFILPEKKLKEKKTCAASINLERYFRGEVIDFTPDFDISYLSPFEQKVLFGAREIGYGKTITYAELAGKIGSRAVRAVGNALGKNPLPIIIPCHRIVARNGPGGYSEGIDIKTRLLEFEKRNANNL